MNTQPPNPLLKISQHRHEAFPFHEIKVEHFIPAIETGISIAKQNIEKIKSNPESPNFINTIEALEIASDDLDRATNTYYVLFAAEAPKELQALAPQVGQLHSQFASDISLDPVLFKRIKTVFDSRKSEQLNTEQDRILEKLYKSFVRNGALLDDDKKSQLRKIDQELAVLGPKFAENTLAATNAYELLLENSEDVKGVPETALEAAAEEAEKRGKKGWVFTLQHPSYLPLVTYADKSEIRHKIWSAANGKNYGDAYDNQDLVKKIATLRHQRAQLLGFATHADYTLEERMALSVDRVRSFLDRLLQVGRPAALRELEELEALKKAEGHSDSLNPWDLSYYIEKLRKKKYELDQEELRKYFELQSVYNGAFKLANKLYDLTFEPVDNVPVYHPDVIVYEVRDSKTREYIGLFYMDFFPRDTKKSGAWMTEIQGQGLWGQEIKRPHIGIVMNFTKPTKTKPSLLTFDEVSTFFHEFGHALHGLISKCRYRSIAGTNVYWDFVELPSQFMENWILEREVLDLFAAHYETKEPLPDDLYRKLKDSSKFMAGYYCLRQVRFGLLDMAWHAANPSNVTDVQDFENKATAATRLLKNENNHISVGFNHVFAGGYSAGYYSYKWAEVLDADAFEYFKENGLFNGDVAKKFKESILMRGGSEHPMDLYKRFRGREPDPDALLRRDGLI